MIFVLVLLSISPSLRLGPKGPRSAVGVTAAIRAGVVVVPALISGRAGFAPPVLVRVTILRPRLARPRSLGVARPIEGIFPPRRAAITPARRLAARRVSGLARCLGALRAVRDRVGVAVTIPRTVASGLARPRSIPAVYEAARRRRVGQTIAVVRTGIIGVRPTRVVAVPTMAGGVEDPCVPIRAALAILVIEALGDGPSPSLEACRVTRVRAAAVITATMQASLGTGMAYGRALEGPPTRGAETARWRSRPALMGPFAVYGGG